ncbi:hypothetical protein MRB53_029638 [Persea americana]|uniref:Uncharacterized protein n=1 Tax=Persea americana TaxID=3435 RepID=A0ACC2KIY4_PERAE|nr:hypothetical protein MRB53_029638 [Persea americana]
MDDPFGVEYFTRSDDEGFGVIYISHWKLSDSEDEENNGGHEKHTEEYDKSSQRSEVKDEEVGHQPEKFAHTLKLSPSEVVFTSCYSSNANAKHVFVLFLQDVNFIILALFHLFGPVYSS